MFNLLKNFFKKEKSERDFGIDFEGWGGLNINNLLVSEFNYLFQYILSKQDLLDKELRIYFEENFEIISENIDHLTKLIDEEMNLDVLREESHFKISHEQAVYNMENMKGILISIHNWTTYKKENNIE